MLDTEKERGIKVRNNNPTGCWGFSEDDANIDDDHNDGDVESSFYAVGNGGLGPRLAPRPDDGEDPEDEKVGELLG